MQILPGGSCLSNRIAKTLDINNPENKNPDLNF